MAPAFGAVFSGRGFGTGRRWREVPDWTEGSRLWLGWRLTA